MPVTLEPKPLEGMDRLMTAVEVSRSLTSELDLDDILQNVLEGAIRIIPNGDAAVLYLYDPDVGKLVFHHAIGFGPELRNIAFAPGEGLAGRAFKNRRPEIYADRSQAVEGMRDTPRESLRKFKVATGGIQYPECALSVPLLYKREVLGALVVENLYKPHVLGEFDLQLLDALAQSAAIAIVNARLYESEREARVRLEAMNKEVRTQKEELEQRLQVSKVLAEAVREGLLPLNDLAVRLQGICKASILVMDTFHRVRVSEPTEAARSLLRQRLEGGASLSDVLRRTARTRRLERLTTEDDGHLIAVPISGAQEVLGFLIIDFGNRRPDAVDETAADSAALIAAAEFLKEHALNEAAQRHDSDLVDSLLGGRRWTGLRAVRPPVYIAVGTVLRPGGPEGALTPDLVGLRNLLGLVRRELTDNPSTAATMRDEGIVVLAPVAEGSDGAHVETIVSRAVEVLHSAYPELIATFALSGPIKKLEELAAAYDEARLAVGIRARLDGSATCFRVQELGAYRFLLRAADSRELASLCQSTLAGVVDHDIRRRTQLLETFRRYLAESGSIRRTARSLGVHVHTVNYRLHRLEELAGLSLNQPDERLTLELAVRILDLCGRDLQRLPLVAQAIRQEVQPRTRPRGIRA